MRKSEPQANDLALPASRRQSRMLEPALLLLLLESDGAHGYDLAARARKLALVGGEVDAAAVYRCLRWFEREGLVRSDWDTSGSGPARRQYFLTDLGVKSVRLWADLLRKRRGVLDQYLARYHEAMPRAMVQRREAARARPETDAPRR